MTKADLHDILYRMKAAIKHDEPCFRIEWRDKDLPDATWNTIRDELWDREGHANERLKYWQGLSLSNIIEFRVNKV